MSYIALLLKQQILSLFMEVMKRLWKYLNNLTAKEIDSFISRVKADEMKDKSEGLLDPELFQQFAIVDREAEFGNALQNGGRKIVPGSVISVKSKKTKLEKHSKPETEKSGKKRKNKNHSGSKSSKKRRS
ncbi:hypothetical protein HAX54_009818 [Datura stramonium]|uniref:Uncharacterized protein n=1 Tax=Datura stramonium TaxID=4076 RepID=A0ABS8TFB1_DATST|nr:hypothetical protein [Datura stramonium]